MNLYVIKADTKSLHNFNSIKSIIMNRILSILILIVPIFVSAQQYTLNSSISDTQWSYAGNAAFSKGNVNSIMLSFTPTGIPYVSFFDYFSYTKQASVMKLSDGGTWQYVGAPKFSEDVAGNLGMVISPVDGTPYVLYSNYGNQLTVKKFNGLNWEAVGAQSISTEPILECRFSINQQGQPYIAFADYNYQLSVMKFDGSNWQYIGKSDFDTTSTNFRLEINPSDGFPYVAFLDIPGQTNPVVMKFNGTEWENVGVFEFPPVSSDDLDLAFDPSDGKPCLAYNSGANDYKVGVKKFDGTNWISVGNPYFSQGRAQNLSLAFSHSGQPFIAFSDWSNYIQLSVMRFNGLNWEYVGTEGFSATPVNCIKLCFNPIDGKPFVAYNVDLIGGKANVMKYDPDFAGIEETNLFAFSVYPNPTTGNLIINIPDEKKEFELSLFNNEGISVMHRKINCADHSIEMSNLACGVYLLQLKDEYSTVTRRVIKL